MLELVWAKSAPFKTLRAHMIDSGMCAMEYLKAPSSRCLVDFLQKMWSCTGDKAIGRAAYLCSLHDIGKCVKEWQKKESVRFEKWKEAGYEKLFQGIQNRNIRHEYYSADIVKKLWESEQSDCMSEEAMEFFSEILALHHQKNKSGTRYLGYSEEWQGLHRKLEEEMRSLFIRDDFLSQPQHVDAVCIFLTGLVILCDWVASSKPFENLQEDEKYIQTSQETAKKTLKLYGLISEEIFPHIDDFHSMWPEIKELRPLQMQCRKLKENALLTIIEAPMGEGKTEAALYLAGKLCNARNKRGIYVALPTQATSNQMFIRMSKMLKQLGIEQVRLLHGAAFMMDMEKILQDMPEESAEWMKPMRRAMLGENAVGTVDQAMAAVLRIKFSVLRLLGLQNKVLVIDEIHSYDVYMGEIICMLLRWCRVLEIPVIMLSATLQERQRKQYLSCYGVEMSAEEKTTYPLITQVTEDGKIEIHKMEASLKSTYVFKPVRKMGNAKAIAERSLQRVEHGGCLCVLVNTVRRAQEIYWKIKEQAPEDVEVIIFHARYPLEKRTEIEKKCLHYFGRTQENMRPQKAILVATQVIEQSLDLDFDGMITEVAPIDLLLQRAGRVHRHRERIRPFGFEQPVIEVLLPEETFKGEVEKRYGLSSFVYDPFLLNNTENLLAEERHIRVPEDIREVIENVYETLTEDNIVEFLKRQTKGDYERNEALSGVFSIPDEATFFPLEEHQPFDLPDIDDGFEAKRRPSTRMGESSVRIAFCTQKLYQKAEMQPMQMEVCKEIFAKSVALRLPDFCEDMDYKKNSKFIKIKTGILKGCIIVCGEKECVLGPYHIFCDTEAGIWWEHEKED